MTAVFSLVGSPDMHNPGMSMLTVEQPDSRREASQLSVPRLSMGGFKSGHVGSLSATAI
jgi:hypothetical protein